jgi:hypothetical protein
LHTKIGYTMDGLKNLLNLKYKLIIIAALCFTVCSSKKEPQEIAKFTETCRAVQKGENLDIVLRTLVDVESASSLINALDKSGFPFNHCLPGDTVKVLMKDSCFVSMTYRQDLTHVYYITVSDGQLYISMKLPYIDTALCLLRGEINSTLYETMLGLDENPNLVFRYTDVFAWEIDFVTETQNGDSFLVYVEKEYCDSVFIGYGNIVVARYKGSIGDFYGLYYKDPEEYEDYYNFLGESLRKSLLKSPLRYSYISSYFTERRFHPILKVWRPHHGLDYSAPIGTPVSSIGAGVVTYKGWRGGYGNLVEVRHKNNFKTRYGHLSKFAKGLYKGKHVEMGELIGYVGSTGLSTGPHLHFELHKNGVPINPLKVKIPRAPSVKKEYMGEFEFKRDSLLNVIERLTQDTIPPISSVTSKQQREES